MPSPSWGLFVPSKSILHHRDKFWSRRGLLEDFCSFRINSKSSRQFWIMPSPSWGLFVPSESILNHPDKFWSRRVLLEFFCSLEINSKSSRQMLIMPSPSWGFFVPSKFGIIQTNFDHAESFLRIVCFFKINSRSSKQMLIMPSPSWRLIVPWKSLLNHPDKCWSRRVLLESFLFLQHKFEIIQTNFDHAESFLEIVCSFKINHLQNKNKQTKRCRVVKNFNCLKSFSN